MQKIVTFLMFNDQAEEAVEFYQKVFKDNAEVTSPMSFKLFGQEFYTFNGGDHFKFTEGMSLFINCEDQAEVDYYWDKLVEGGGRHSQCGWLQDRFGVSWQVIPTVLMQLSGDPDRAKAQRVTNAMLKMTKINIAELEAAAKGE
jgi:predicted 3-demethylubiquinone-9 3-methyltransferase (glyoxalase superfamily)